MSRVSAFGAFAALWRGFGRPFASAAAIIVVGAVGFTACTASSVLEPRPDVDVGMRTSALPQLSVRKAAPPGTHVTAAAYPRAISPGGMAFGAMPRHEIACRNRLKQLGVRFRDLPPIHDGGACRIDHPVEISSLGRRIGLQPAATLDCEMAATFAKWTQDELQPSARTRYLSGIRTVHQGSSYSCRRIRGTRTASEHSKGNAIDVMGFELNNGKEIDVRRPGFFAFREKSLLNNVRAGGCQYFSTVLGPGYDRDHADHFHFDIKERRSGYVACR